MCSADRNGSVHGAQHIAENKSSGEITRSLLLLLLLLSRNSAACWGIIIIIQQAAVHYIKREEEEEVAVAGKLVHVVHLERRERRVYV